MGLPVERREVIGSRWPHRIAPWVRWLGYGFLIARSAYLLLRLDTVWSLLLACIELYFAAFWLGAVLANRSASRPPDATDGNRSTHRRPHSWRVLTAG